MMIKFVDIKTSVPEPVLEARIQEAGLDTLHEPHHLVLHNVLNNVLHSVAALCLLKTSLNDGLSFIQHLDTEQVKSFESVELLSVAHLGVLDK